MTISFFLSLCVLFFFFSKYLQQVARRGCCGRTQRRYCYCYIRDIIYPSFPSFSSRFSFHLNMAETHIRRAMAVFWGVDDWKLKMRASAPRLTYQHLHDFRWCTHPGSNTYSTFKRPLTYMNCSFILFLGKCGLSLKTIPVWNKGH